MKRCSRRFRRLASLLALPASILPASATTGGSTTTGTDKTYIIATPGKATPDGLDTIHGPTIFSLSERGMAYRAKAVNSGIEALYTVRQAGVAEVVRIGTVIPNYGTVASFLGKIVTNDNGDVATIAGIRNAGGVVKDAVIVGNASSGIRVLAVQDQPVPGGGWFNSFSEPSMNDLGQVSFCSGSTIYLVEPNGTVITVASSGQPAPGEAFNFSSLNSSPKMEDLGKLFFGGWIMDSGHGTGYNYATYRRDPLGGITQLFRSRQPAPGTSAFFGSAGLVMGTHPSGKFTIYSTLINSANTQVGRGIFTGTSSADITAVAYSGQTAPSGAGTYTSFSSSSSVNSAGTAAYVGYCSGGTASVGLFTGQGGSQSLLLKNGQTAPGGNTYTGFEFPVINDSGTILFAANLNGNQTLQGIYLTDGVDVIKVAQAGDTVDGRTIQSLGVDPKAFNGHNQVAYQATLSGGISGYSILLFAPRLEWRGLIGGEWDDAFNWTASLVPSEYNDVDIIPPDPIMVFGPLADTLVKKLTIGTESEGGGLTEFKLRTGKISASAGVTVNQGGKLSGAGIIAGSVTNTSVVAPGDSAGRLQIDGNYGQTQSGSLQVEIADVDQFDVLEVDGDVTLSGSLNVQLLGSALASLTPATEITFLTATGQITGQFAGLPEGARVQVAGGLGSFAVSYRGQSVALTSFQAGAGATDSDADGIPDSWMLEHFGATTGNTGNGTAAGSDADGDGRTNLDEYLAGTNPNSGSDRFTAVVTEVDASNVTIRFASVAGHNYSVEFSADLSGSWETIRTGIAGNGSEQDVIVARPGGESSSGYYRVVVTR